MQSAFYINQITLPDPIFPFTKRTTNLTQALSLAFDIPSSNSLNRKSLAIALKKMKELVPMVAADYVKFFPSSYLHETKDYLPITISKTAYSDIIPKTMLDEYRKRTIAKSLEQNGRHIKINEKFKISRSISVEFEGDVQEGRQIFNLFDNEILSRNDETLEVKVSLSLPKHLPSKETFDNWVNQSINQTANRHFKHLMNEFELSSLLNSSFLTSSELKHSLLGVNEKNTEISSFTSNCMFNLDLPFIKGVSMENLMKARLEEGDAFQNFRIELEKILRDFRYETDIKELNLKIDNHMHELNDVGVHKVMTKIKSMKRTLLANSVIAIGGLAGSIVTSGFSLAATGVAAAQGFDAYNKYKAELNENPSYFLWKVKKQ